MRQRLDRELAARGLARSRSHAQTMINSGAVSVDGVIITRPAELVESTAQINADADHYVSRAAHKLLGALDDLGLSVSGRALDAGSSTGGFTQVLLERGCTQVIAIDVGTDQLAPAAAARSAGPGVGADQPARSRASSMSTASRSTWWWPTCPSSPWSC